MIKMIEEIKTCLESLDSTKINSLKDMVLNSRGKITILGNGGSNAISAHIAEDYTKALKKPTMAFTDGAMLTCYSNDYGYHLAFRQYLSEFHDKDGLVILISSSGNSKNILECANYCVDNNLKFVILSGFNRNNNLKMNYSDKASLEFWVDSTNYGVVECIHEIILHSVI
jgi:D-sedoheptulose 7-phosphate isomerase